MNDRAITTYNLRTQDFRTYVGIDRRRAVIASYAQAEKHDYNTWDYDQYDHLVEEGDFTFVCGDWAVIKSDEIADAIHVARENPLENLS